MIRLAEFADIDKLKRLWKISFGDNDDYINLFFSKKFKPKFTVVFENDEGDIVSSLFIQKYKITFYKSFLPVAYFCGIATLPEYRKKGIASQLVSFAENYCKKKKIQIFVLVPAEKSLFDYYEKLGYTQVFDKGEEPINFFDANENLYSAFRKFQKYYRVKNFCIQKTFSDFKTIREELLISGGNRYNLWGMAKISDVLFCSKLLEENIPNLSFDFSHFLNLSPAIEKEKVNSSISSEQRKVFCRLFFGYHIDEFNEEKYNIFPRHNPIINFMLE